MRVSAGAIVIAMLVSIGGAATAGASGAVVSPELLEAAAARGSARVVVQLTVSEGRRRRHDRSGQASPLDRLSAGTTYRVLRDLPGLPVVVLEASAETLGALAISPSVVHVSEDEIRRPQQ